MENEHVYVFVAARAYDGAGVAPALPFAAGAQILVLARAARADGGAPASLWCFGEHRGARGWFPAAAGELARFRQTAMLEAVRDAGAATFGPADAYYRAVVAPPGAADGAPQRARWRATVLEAMRAAHAEEAAFEAELGALIASFVRPLETRDSELKRQLLGHPATALSLGLLDEIREASRALLAALAPWAAAAAECEYAGATARGGYERRLRELLVAGARAIEAFLPSLRLFAR